ncbi:hypothetical protein [Natronoarchaeum mannanilyticum]|uniref:Zincin peptidase n=1 Tax=Natronoarchaeum mannanilyticum TaxID=926360 RepID=A0AAV3TA85_9EURY
MDPLQLAATPLRLLAVGAVLLCTLGLGTVAHEYAHALALRAIGVDYEIRWLGDRGSAGLLRAGLLGTWASVRPRTVPADAPAWGVRLAALMPLTLLAPFALVVFGVLPDPLATGDPRVVAAAVAWAACALPSPQDFSVVWYAETAIERAVADD